MKNPYFFLLSLSVLLVILSVCTFFVFRTRTFTNELEILDRVDQIELTVYQLNDDGIPSEVRFRHMIKNPERISSIIQIIRTFSDSWQYDKFSPPWTGVTGRQAPVEITFYRNGQFETSLRIGYSRDISYFLQQSPGPGRYLGYQEFKEIMKILEIDENFVHHER